MYTKPPGYEAAQIRDRELADKKARAEAEAAAAAAAGAAATADGSSQPQQQLPGPPDKQQQQQQGRRQQQQQGPADEAMRQRQMDMDKLREDPFAAILAARSALQASDKFVLKSVEGVYGGTLPSAGNQMLLEDEPSQGGPAAEIDGERRTLQDFWGEGRVKGHIQKHVSSRERGIKRKPGVL
jgi:hypothetical protein